MGKLVQSLHNRGRVATIGRWAKSGRQGVQAKEQEEENTSAGREEVSTGCWAA
jgi:hypothetical protein